MFENNFQLCGKMSKNNDPTNLNGITFTSDIMGLKVATIACAY